MRPCFLIRVREGYQGRRFREWTWKTESVFRYRNRRLMIQVNFWGMVFAWLVACLLGYPVKTQKLDQFWEGKSRSRNRVNRTTIFHLDE